jgi:hypothetical protein
MLNHGEQRGKFTLLLYMNHLLKYYELVDTVFLVLKHKPRGFLHGYLHPATVVLTWGQLIDSTGFQWVVILLNLFVHTVMYFYYGMAALRVNIPWKKLVTLMQISQFIADLFGGYYIWASSTLRGQCFSTYRAGLVGCFIVTSYLYLFIDFYETTYHPKARPRKKV